MGAWAATHPESHSVPLGCTNSILVGGPRSRKTQWRPNPRYQRKRSICSCQYLSPSGNRDWLQRSSSSARWISTENKGGSGGARTACRTGPGARGMRGLRGPDRAHAFAS